MLELAADGGVLVLTPTGSETGGRNSELSFRLQRFARSGTTWKAFDSSTVFHFPDNSVLSPDASLVRLDRWQFLVPKQRRGFATLCPDLVVELVSPSDEAPRALTPLRSKMAAYQAKGARRGVTADYEINLVTLISTMAGQQELPNPRTFLYSDTHAEEFI